MQCSAVLCIAVLDFVPVLPEQCCSVNLGLLSLLVEARTLQVLYRGETYTTEGAMLIVKKCLEAIIPS